MLKWTLCFLRAKTIIINHETMTVTFTEKVNIEHSTIRSVLKKLFAGK